MDVKTAGKYGVVWQFTAPRMFSELEP